MASEDKLLPPSGEQPSNASTKSETQTPRPRKPNYAQIHSRPLPLDVYPLPAFIPHNPLSIVRIAIAFISHSIWPPISPKIVHQAYFSAETQSIHVTDPKSIRALWEQGFWGTGSLSRSEPRWLDQEKRKRGLTANQTSEEVTQQRRKERRQFKLERARQEREAIEQQQRAEGKLEEVVENGDLPASPKTTFHSDDLSESNRELLNIGAQSEPMVEFAEAKEQNSVFESLPEELAMIFEDQEHLQLTLEEAFFLTYVLGALKICKEDALLPSPYLLRLFCAYSTFPAPEHTEQQLYTLFECRQVSSNFPLDTSDVHSIAPDNPFLLKYVVFHHFRSLGWVVRPGIKFAVDYLLYNRGPAFSHAEFAIMIIPSYINQYWSESAGRIADCKKKESRDWWWLHRINRVQTQVHKTLMLVYVEVPPPWDTDYRGKGFEVNIGDVLKKYKIREFVFKRWTPNRNRG